MAQAIVGIIRNLLGSSSIIGYMLRRMVASLPVLFLITLVSFLMIRAIPGGPFVSSGERAMPQDVIDALNRYYGLDRPLLLNLPGQPGWQLLHYVDETITQRVEIVDLSGDFKAALVHVTDDSVRAALGDRFAPALQRITLYRDQGVQVSELPGLLSDLAAIRDTLRNVVPGLAAQLDAAISTYQHVDPSTLSTSPTLRTTTRKVLYCDLFQSQFGNYVFNLLRLDFGPSLGLNSRGRPVGQIIGEKLPISMELGILAVAAALLIGLPLGILAAVHHNGLIDQAAMLFAVLGRSVPNIVLGPVLIIFFAVKLNLFPVVNPYV